MIIIIVSASEVCCDLLEDLGCILKSTRNHFYKFLWYCLWARKPDLIGLECLLLLFCTRFFIFLLYPLSEYYCYLDKLLIFTCLFCNESFYWILLISSTCFQWIILSFMGLKFILTVNNDGFLFLSNNYTACLCLASHYIS